MFVHLPSSVPCETMKDKSNSCNRPATVGLLRAVETLGFCGYTMEPICHHCIRALSTLAGHAPSADSEAISASTIKQVLAQRLGLEGADEVLCALRAAGSAEDSDDGDD